jgi:uncharacterized membrane protein
MSAGRRIWGLLILILARFPGASRTANQRLAFFNPQHLPLANSSQTLVARNLQAPVSTTPSSRSSTSTRFATEIDPRQEISISKSISVPFSATVAFDAFSDLPRQADFSPWLRKVEYLTPPPPGVDRVGTNWGETKWHMGFRGFSYSWNAICTILDRPRCIEWESTTGLKNFGRVVFEEQAHHDDHPPTSVVTLTMTFVAPRIVANLFRRSNALVTLDNMILAMLHNFRDIVAEENRTGNCNTDRR